MADDAENPNIDDELLLAEELEPGKEPPEGEEEEGEETLSFGDEAEEQEGDSNLVKHLRQQIKERDKRLAETARTATRDEPIVVGPEPQLEDYDFDGDKYREAIRAYDKRVAAAERQKNAANEAGKAEAEAWAAELSRYNEGKSKLPFKDTEDAEETVKASLDTAQQAVLIMAADDPARLTYALGRHPAKLAELAAEKNPLKLAAKIAKLEGTLKVVKGKVAPNIDAPERGSGKHSHVRGDQKLKKLEEQAVKTGDRTELISYKKELERAAKAKK